MSKDKTSISGINNSVVNTGNISGSVTNNISLAGIEANTEEKEDLTILFKKLEVEIARLPSEKSEEAKTLMKRLKLIVSSLDEPQPDKEAIHFGLDSLKKAAENVASVVPTILPIALEIAKKIQNLI